VTPCTIIRHVLRDLVYALATAEGNMPRVRHHVHRSFLSPINSQLTLLVSTADVRTPKISQFISHDEATPNAEVAWWIADASEQYRISAFVHVLPSPGHHLESRFPTKRFALSSNDGSTLGWEAERIKTFDEKMGDELRASFCRPTPGSDLKGGYDEAKKWPETLPPSTEAKDGKEKEMVQEALTNFALLVLEPVSVERVELGIIPNRRTKWSLKEDGSWEEKILVP
jgi:pyridoxamine 5'-phosphate oxidase